MLRDSALLAVLVVGLVIVITWPLAGTLSTTLLLSFDDPDLQVGLWWPHAVARSLFAGEPLFLRPELAWPDGQDTRMLLWNVAVQLLFAPIARFADPVSTLNLITLGGMAINGLLVGLAARWLTGSRAAAVTAAIVGSTSAYAFIEGVGGRPEQALWGPIALYLAGLVLLRAGEGSRKTLLVMALSLAATGAIYWFYAYFLVVITGILLVGWLWSGSLERRTAIRLVWVGLGSLLLVSPFLVPILSAFIENRSFFASMEQHGGDAVAAQLSAALTVPGSFIGPPVLGAMGPVQAAGSTHNAYLAPVLSVPIIGLFLWKMERAPRLLGWVLLIGLLMTLGPVLQVRPGEPLVFGHVGLRMPLSLVNLLPGFSRLWWPYRWLGVVIPALALALGWVVSRARRPIWMAAAVSAVVLTEAALSIGGLIQHALPALDTRFRDALGALAALDGVHPVLQIPLPSDESSRNMVGLAAWHQQPIDGGVGWNIPVVRTAAHRQREVEVPLIQDLSRVQGGLTALEHPGPWTSAETGGFHFVVLFPGAPDLDRLPHASGYQTVLGRPFFCDDFVVIWAIPGVAEVPPAYRDAFESDTDPCEP